MMFFKEKEEMWYFHSVSQPDGLNYTTFYDKSLKFSVFLKRHMAIFFNLLDFFI